MEYVLAIVPSAGVLFLFWLAVRAMVTADRRERAAHARMARDTASPVPSQAPSPVKGSDTQGSDVTPNG
jgi:threonine/homoserine/homoserine lactone efflux protein